MGRWDHLYDLAPRAAVDVLLDEAAKSFAEDLRLWPPPLEELDPKLAGLLEGPRPHDSAYRAAFALVRLDLQHEYEELDRFQSAERWKEQQLTPRERDQALLLFRVVGEMIFALSEAVQSRLPRPKLVELVDRLERRTLASSGEA